MRQLCSRQLPNFSTATIIGFFILLLLYTRTPPPTSLLHLDLRNGHSRCHDLSGADKTVVVMKTGATEFIDKFPVHVKTTLSCYPNYMVVSDHEEVYQGVQIRNVLTAVSSETRQSNPKDFQLFNRLQQGGRQALTASELSGPDSRDTGNAGKIDQPGWLLDKWKFLPMLNKTLHQFPLERWYFFVETDTAFFWSNLLQLTSTLNPDEPHYIGNENQIGGIQFAHGGSGILLSHAALRLAVDQYVKNQRSYEDFTAKHWAGDCVLAKVLLDVGVKLTYGDPTFQGKGPGIMLWEGDAGIVKKKPRWCYPIVTMHHVRPEVIKDVWDFEQEYVIKGEKTNTPLLYRDLFLHHILSQMREVEIMQPDWDNQSGDMQAGASDYESCHLQCLRESTCLQYRFDPVKQLCSANGSPKLGIAAAGTGMRSGWMYDRVQKWVAERANCKEVGKWWLT